MIVKRTIRQAQNGIEISAEFCSQKTNDLAMQVERGSMSLSEYCRRMDEWRSKTQGA